MTKTSDAAMQERFPTETVEPVDRKRGGDVQVPGAAATRAERLQLSDSEQKIAKLQEENAALLKQLSRSRQVSAGAIPRIREADARDSINGAPTGGVYEPVTTHGEAARAHSKYNDWTCEALQDALDAGSEPYPKGLAVLCSDGWLALER